MMPETEAWQPKTEAEKSQIRVERIIALWALSEAALGGVLHAFRFPFTGLVINSSAVLFMVLIASASEKKGTILRATVIVLIIKGIVSPHTPLAAYVAVGFQGMMGELLLRSKKYLLVSSLALGIITLLQSAIQKILMLTIVYGNALWKSIDLFGNFLISQFPFLPQMSNQMEFSLWLISLHIGIHLLAGISIGVLAARVPGWLEQEFHRNTYGHKIKHIPENIDLSFSKKQRKGIKKPSMLIVLLLSASLFISSYIFPEISKTQGMEAVIMIIRAGFIMFFWYTFLGPLAIKLYQRLMENKKTVYATQVQETIDILPVLRYIIQQTWQSCGEHHGTQRIKAFIVLTLANILTVEI